MKTKDKLESAWELQFNGLYDEIIKKATQFDH